MGCDIHFVIEMEKVRWDPDQHEDVGTGEWVGVFATNDSPLVFTERDKLPDVTTAERVDYTIYDRWPALKQRNYYFFAALAGVRGAGPEPKGFPPNASDLATYCCEGWGVDAHSHSWDTLENFVRMWLVAINEDEAVAASVAKTLSGGAQDILAFVGGVYTEDLGRYRVLYWFDN